MELKKKLILLLFLVQSSFCDECGTREFSQPSVFGGNEAHIGQWPWFARLFERSKLPPFAKFFCGATLLSDSHLLTAAHCVQDIETKELKRKEDIFAMLGGLDISKLSDKRWVYRGISKIEVHPDFGRTVEESISRHDADIAILTLEIGVRFDHLVNRICLPPLTATVSNATGTIVGHGLNEQDRLEDIPKYITVTSITWQDCIFKNRGYINDLSSRGFCAGLPHQIPCKGDSGGGFYVFMNNRWQIYGIVASALASNYGQCDATKQAIFTNVISFSNWINQKIRVEEVQDIKERNPSTKHCGVRKVRNRVKRVIGGRKSYLGEWPWFVRLYLKLNSEFLRAATLISERHLLAAANCIQGKKFSATKAEELFVMLGGLDISKLHDKSWTRRDISKVDVHPDWDTTSDIYDADIAVLTMNQAVQLSEFIQIVCLPSRNEQVFDIDGSTVGHGYDEYKRIQAVPKTLQLSSISNKKCFMNSELAKISSNRTFCAGSKNVIKLNFRIKTCHCVAKLHQFVIHV